MNDHQAHSNKPRQRPASGPEYFYMLVAVGLFPCFILVPLWISMFFGIDKHVHTCAQSSTGKIIPDRVIDGVLQKTYNAYFVHSDLAGDARLSTCAKGHCSGPGEVLRQSQPGDPIHAEYCGATLTAVSLAGTEIYTASPKTQENLDQRRLTNRAVLSVALLTCLFIAAKGLFEIQRAKSKLAKTRPSGDNAHRTS